MGADVQLRFLYKVTNSESENTVKVPSMTIAGAAVAESIDAARYKDGRTSTDCTEQKSEAKTWKFINRLPERLL